MEPLVNADPPPGSEEKESKEAHINLRIATTDRRTIEGKAQRAGLSVADYMHRAKR
jgi:predicted DNA binding CopG/RHH family protein